MTVEDFKRQLAECREPRAVERLLACWWMVKGTYDELKSLHDAVIERMDALDPMPVERGGAFMAEGIPGVTM